MAIDGDDLLFRAFADRRRLRILHLLREGEACVGDLVAILDLPQSTVSRQLGLLRKAGLVAVREDGLWHHYALSPPGTPLHDHLLACLGRCFTHVPELKRDARRAAAVRADGGCCPGAAQPAAGEPARSCRTSPAPK